MVVVDGSQGEGGGQVLRTCLSLSLLTGTPFRIANIRAGRARPGLMRQHLVCVQAAAEIGGARVAGADLGATELTFEPKGVRGGEFTFALGGAGSTTLVFQTILLPLLLAAGVPSQLRFKGGTHNPMAPPVDFLVLSFLPLLAKMGADVRVTFDRHGFYPAGGGSWSADVLPAAGLGRLDLMDRGAVRAHRASALVAQIPSSVALRELDVLAGALGWDRQACRTIVVRDSQGPGNALLVIAECEHVTEVISGFGERGIRAEQVATQVAAAMARYLGAGVPIGEHLADQLLLPMALGGGGTFRTLAPSRHCTTQIALLERFLGVVIAAVHEGDEIWRIEVPTPGGVACVF
jgi:RNA 3'-terminal phosphate cyclase (ATP)